MRKKILLLTIATLMLTVVSASQAGHDDDLWSRDTLTNGVFGLNDQLADSGIEIGFGVTNTYQQNLRGGLSRNHRAGRHSGSYDLEVTGDLKQLLGIEGATLFLHGEGLWSQTESIDASSVGTAFTNINADAGPRRSMDITEFWYEQSFLSDTLFFRIGKLDITGGFECRGCPVSFDGNAYANDETSQFLNAGLVNNLIIPFPDKGLGAVVYYNPVEWWYIGGGVVDAQTDARETGFRTAFHKNDYFTYFLETGIAPRFDSPNGPLQGAYRVGIWYDPQPKGHTDDGDEKTYRDDVGVYTSFDQMLCKENDDPEDSQGVGAFFKYGFSHSKTSDITHSWSAGLQYQGLVDGRDDDVLGIGFAQVIFNNASVATYDEDNEGVLEVYYNMQVTPWLNITPNVQYIINPGGNRRDSDTGKVISNAVVIGLRTQSAW